MGISARQARAWRARVWALAAGLLAIMVGSAGGAPPATVLLEELTWTEVRDLVRDGTTTVIIPAGGTEQNGPHMALGKHNARVRALSEQIARAVGSTLVAPVLAYVPEGGLDPPTGHMRFPGTLSIPEDAFRATVEHAARSLARHGFRDVVLLGDHGGTQASLRAVVSRLGRAWAGTPARAHFIEAYFRASDVAYRELLGRQGYGADELGTHAGLGDTSLMLAVDARMVRPERLEAGTGLRTGNGVAGDPRRASAELGRPGVETIVRLTVAAIRQAIASRPGG